MTFLKEWTFVFDETAEKQFSKLDKSIQKQIVQGIQKIIKTPNPKVLELNLKDLNNLFGVTALVISESL